eukprot:gene5901-7314_t
MGIRRPARHHPPAGSPRYGDHPHATHDARGALPRRQTLGSHENRAAFKALQEMVVAWDVMPAERKRGLATCGEVVENALLLYALARHAIRELNKGVAARKSAIDAAEKRAPGGSPTAQRLAGIAENF